MSKAPIPDDGRSHLFDKPRNVSRLLRSFYLICVVLFVADIILHRHTTHPWEGVTGFYAVYGFVACVVLVLIAKEIRKVLMRKENYYDVDE